MNGIDAAAGRSLGVTSIGHISAFRDLAARKSIPSGAVTAMIEQIAQNWAEARTNGISSASRENWRWCRPQTRIDWAKNTSKEVRLERSIAGCAATGHLPDWANQIPICSGVVGPSADRKRAIDLVYKAGDKHFQFIELKIDSNTPLHAAIEIIGYGCVWLLARGQHELPRSELLAADRIDLIVLAPQSYYGSYTLAVLAAALNDELTSIGREQGIHLSFRFEILPNGLAEEPRPSAKDVAALLGQRRPL